MGQDLNRSGENVLVVSMYTVFRGPYFFLIGCYGMKGLGFSLTFGLNTVHIPLMRFLYILVSYIVAVVPGQSSD